MGRIIAIDYGTKRTGIAVTDTLQITANGLTTVPTLNLISFLDNYFKQENVDCIVVGEPFDDHNKPSQSTPAIESFIKKFKKIFPGMPVEREDESYTSKQAFDTMLKAGLKKKKRKDKALIDQISATLILQKYMERNSI